MRRHEQRCRHGFSLRRALVAVSIGASLLLVMSAATAMAQTDTTAVPAPTTLAPTTLAPATATAPAQPARPVDDDGADRLVLIGLIAVAVIVALVVLWYASGHVRRARREETAGAGYPPEPRTR